MLCHAPFHSICSYRPDCKLGIISVYVSDVTDLACTSYGGTVRNMYGMKILIQPHPATLLVVWQERRSVGMARNESFQSSIVGLPASLLEFITDVSSDLGLKPTKLSGRWKAAVSCDLISTDIIKSLLRYTKTIIEYYSYVRSARPWKTFRGYMLIILLQAHSRHSYVVWIKS